MKSKNTLEKILLGGIGSFILVLLFPHGVKYFFRNMFAEMVQAIVTIVLTALITQKLAERITQSNKTPHLPDA